MAEAQRATHLADATGLEVTYGSSAGPRAHGGSSVRLNSRAVRHSGQTESTSWAEGL